MQTITLRSHIGPDGISQLLLPDELKNQDVTAIVRSETPEWLSVLQKTAGAMPDLERPPQGKYEVRESLITHNVREFSRVQHLKIEDWQVD